jgi:hypothetical protein
MSHHHKQGLDKGDKYFLNKAMKKDLVKRFFEFPPGFKSITVFGAANFDHASKGLSHHTQCPFSRLGHEVELR